MNNVSVILGTKYPLIQAPMSWITDANLVASVSNAGGLGVLGPYAGTDPNKPYVEKSFAEKVEQTAQEIQKTKALTDKPFGINVIVMTNEGAPLDDFTQISLQAAFAQGVRHFITVGNAHSQVFAEIKKRNGIIIHRPLTPTVSNMREAQAKGADLLVATGYDEGGHIPRQAWGTFTVVPTMVDALDIPVLGAGGINDRRGVKAMFALGAKGVFIGTRFIATQESPASKLVKQKILQSGYADILAVSPIQRSIHTLTAEKLAQQFADKNNQQDLDEVIAKLGGLRPAMLEGKLDEGIISVNTGIDIIQDIPSVAQLVHQLMED